MPPFDPEFDDCAWNEGWTRIPLMQVVPGRYDGFDVTTWQMTTADICGRQVRLSPPLDIRGLVTSDGTLWMSDVPQERLMMWNNARISRGRILVGGMGLGLYAQYAMPNATRMTIVECSAEIAAVVGPLVRVAAESYGVPLDIQVGDIETYLQAEQGALFDTIFLDTWDTLDAAHLPAINRLRNLAIRRLAPEGRVLLWGYRWMVHLFEAACEQLLQVEPARRERWLHETVGERPEVIRLLAPVHKRFAGGVVSEMESALSWCRDYIIGLTG